MTIANTVASKLTVAFVAAAMLFTLATPAKAATMEELQAQIQALMAQIAALTSSSSTGAGAAACTFTRALTVGAQGADVNCLQNYLTSTGHFSFSGGSTGYFGPVTASAVAAWQGANGVSPAVGYFGPVSQAKYNALMASAPTTPTTPGTDDSGSGSSANLQGGEGDVDVTTLTSGAVSIDLGDSESVLEFEVEAVDSDVSINRVDFFFKQAGVGARPWLYFKEVNLLVDGEEVASLTRSSDFSDQNTDGWRARFSGLDIVVREDDTAEIALELVVLDSMSGERDDHTIVVDMKANGIRFLDGMGVYETSGIVANASVSFTDTFGDGTAKVTISDASPEALTIVLNETSRTTGNEVLAFNVKAEDSDIEVDTVTVVYTTTGSGTAAAVYRARLYADGSLLSTKSITGSVTASTTVFNTLDYMIDEDDEVEFTVEIDFNRGDSFLVPATFTVVSAQVQGENADFGAINKTLTVNEAHTLIVEGVTLKGGSMTTSVVTNTTNADDSYGEFRVRYDVTAVGETVWVPLTAWRGASTTAGAAFQIEDSNGTAIPSAGTTTQSLTRVSGGSVSGGFVRITDGQTATFELYVTYNPATAGQFRVQLLSVAHNDTEAALPNVSPVTTASPAEDFETGNQNITS